MPAFSKESLDKLNTCHPDIRKVMIEAIKYYDFKVIFGNRSIAEQQALYAQGRTKPGQIVTKLDGVNKKSKHNHAPSLAIDIVPFPIDWNDLKRFKDLSEVVLKAAKTVGVNLKWGGNWKSFKDYPHYEL